MKKLLSLALSVFYLSSLSVGAGLAEAQPGGAIAQSKGHDPAAVLQSLEKLLRQKGYGLLPGFKTWQRMTSWKAEGCRVQYVITDEGGGAHKFSEEPSVDVKRHTHARFALDLSDLDPQTIAARPYRDIEGGIVSYRIQGEKKLIRVETRYLEAPEPRSGGWLILKDKESLDEAAALLRRAVSICRR